jgi:hypothetical protein
LFIATDAQSARTDWRRRAPQAWWPISVNASALRKPMKALRRDVVNADGESLH